MREGIVRRKRVLWLRGDPGTSVWSGTGGGNLHLPADPDPVLYIGPQDGSEGTGDGGAAGGDGGGRAGGSRRRNWRKDGRRKVVEDRQGDC